MKREPRGLGRQAPAVLAAPRRAPAVLAKIGAPATPELQAIRAMQAAIAKAEAERRALLGDLGEAIDGWEAGAPTEEIDRITAMRRRWGISPDSTSALTDDVGKE